MSSKNDRHQRNYDISTDTSKAATSIPTLPLRPTPAKTSCSRRIGRSSLDDAREALSEYLALLSPTPESESFIITGREGIVGGAGGGEATAFSAPEKGDGTVGAPTVDLDKSLKAVLKLYGRAVDVLRDKQERELLTEALCDLGDLHVSENTDKKGEAGAIQFTMYSV